MVERLDPITVVDLGLDPTFVLIGLGLDYISLLLNRGSKH